MILKKSWVCCALSFPFFVKEVITLNEQGSNRDERKCVRGLLCCRSVRSGLILRYVYVKWIGIPCVYTIVVQFSTRARVYETCTGQCSSLLYYFQKSQDNPKNSMHQHYFIDVTCTCNMQIRKHWSKVVFVTQMVFWVATCINEFTLPAKYLPRYFTVLNLHSIKIN